MEVSSHRFSLDPRDWNSNATKNDVKTTEVARVIMFIFCIIMVKFK